MFECRRLLAWNESTGITRLVADHHRRPVDKADIIARTRSGSFSYFRPHSLCRDSINNHRYNQRLCQLLSTFHHNIAAPSSTSGAPVLSLERRYAYN
jgi:hypothetical protein